MFHKLHYTSSRLIILRITGIFEGIMSPDDAVFSDQLNHASMIDGLRLCKAQKFRYQHNGTYTYIHTYIHTCMHT